MISGKSEGRALGGEEGELAAVEDGGVGELEIRGGDADVNDAPGKCRILKTGGHRFRAACGVDDDVGEFAIVEFLQIGERRAVGLGEDALFNTEVFGAEIESPLHHVHDDHIDAVQEFEEFETSEADGTGTDDEDGFARLRIAALHGVVANRQGLDEGELVVGKVFAGMEFARGNDERAFAKPAVVMDADDLDAGAAVGVAFFRGRGFGVVDVGLERAFVAGFDIGHALTDGDDFESEFMSRGSWIGEERK